MIIDVTGVILTPGNGGKDCLGNGTYYDIDGKLIEICCDECDYQLCCITELPDCENCTDSDCPHLHS